MNRWKPEEGKGYWYFNLIFQPIYDILSNADSDKFFYSNYNCFQTRAEALVAAERVKALMMSLHEEAFFNSISKKVQLPDWCKVGEWVWSDGEYHKIIEAGEDWFRTSWGDNNGLWGTNMLHHFKQARPRPYNAEEIPDLPFEVTERNSNFRTTVVSCQGNKV